MVLISIPAVVSDSTGESTVFATCPDTQSTIMLEFQGVIEMDGSTFAGNKLGLLSILDGGVKAQLVIGNHRLEGKVIKLAKALMLIQKQKPPKDDKSMDKTVESAPTIQPTWHPGTQHYGNSTLDDRGPFSGPPSSPPHHDDDDTMTSVDYNPKMRQEQSKEVGEFNPLAPENLLKKTTFDSVAIIRQKILFNTMPIPIIHTERSGLTVIKRGV
ncbi:hypothetical protein BGZ74_010706 [Mortierella antarctica]|nr:hypothetical protein BGZ74_010706 [Mortierella antarctica]